MEFGVVHPKCMRNTRPSMNGYTTREDWQKTSIIMNGKLMHYSGWQKRMSHPSKLKPVVRNQLKSPVVSVSMDWSSGTHRSSAVIAVLWSLDDEKSGVQCVDMTTTFCALCTVRFVGQSKHFWCDCSAAVLAAAKFCWQCCLFLHYLLSVLMYSLHLIFMELSSFDVRQALSCGTFSPVLSCFAAVWSINKLSFINAS